MYFECVIRAKPAIYKTTWWFNVSTFLWGKRSETISQLGSERNLSIKKFLTKVSLSRAPSIKVITEERPPSVFCFAPTLLPLFLTGLPTPRGRLNVKTPIKHQLSIGGSPCVWLQFLLPFETNKANFLFCKL